ncbi:MAG TPA: hypothetical protein VGG27_07415 [Magnetospirillaceae bacterium]|jgi:hypothetical protein
MAFRFSRFGKIAAVCMLVALPTESLHAAIDVCEPDRLGDIDNAAGSLTSVEKLIPLVPPEESAYLEAEYAAAKDADSSKRLAALMQRPSFHAWRLHVQFASTMEKIKYVQRLPKDAGIKSHIQAALSIDYELSEATGAWREYVSADEENILNGVQIKNGSYLMAYTFAQVDHYMWCWANLIDDKK